MFIPVSMMPPSNEPSKYVADAHVSLEQVKGFFTRLKTGPQEDAFVVETDDNEYYVSKETYALLKSLVLRP